MQETDGLIVEDPSGSRRNGLSKKQKIIIGSIIGVVLVVVLIVVIAVVASKGSSTDKTKPNIIFLIGDGLGPQITSLARIYTKYIRENTNASSLFFSEFGDEEEYLKYHNDPLDGVASHECGLSFTTTYSASSVVTDSAASATALSAGQKTINGYVGLDTERRPIANIIEAASLRGYTGGIVCTARITHATPAGFTAHVPDRNDEERIAVQQATVQEHISVYIGGGSNKFRPGLRKSDKRNLLDEAAARGFAVATSKDELAEAVANTSITRLLAPITEDHFPYEMERDPAVLPSLAENVESAWKVLKRGDKPFFMMVEGSLIDFCGHNNDPSAGVKETIAFFKAVDKALALAEKDGNTLVFVVADHDTGGLSLAGGLEGDAFINFEALRNADMSVPTIISRINASTSLSHDQLYAYVRSLLIDHQGFDPAYNNSEHIEAIVAARGTNALLAPVADAIADNVGMTYGTTHHTATNILFYSCLKHWKGKHSAKVSIKLDNAEIPRWIGEQLSFDFAKATEEVRKTFTDTEVNVKSRKHVPCTDQFHCRV